VTEVHQREKEKVEKRQTMERDKRGHPPKRPSCRGFEEITSPWLKPKKGATEKGRAKKEDSMGVIHCANLQKKSK